MRLKGNHVQSVSCPRNCNPSEKNFWIAESNCHCLENSGREGVSKEKPGDLPIDSQNQSFRVERRWV